MPNRRKAWTHKVKICDPSGNPQTYYLTCGEYDDGTLGEIFIEAHKEGTFTRGILQCLARMASMALQCGATPEDVAKSLKNLSFPPNGGVEGSAAVEHCTSVADWIAREVEAAYVTKSGKGPVTDDSHP